jgi:hypothetical protein
MADLHSQTRALGLWAQICTRDRAEHGEHAAPIIPTGTSFTIIGRKLRDREH